MFRHTLHSKAQIEKRGIISEGEVLKVIESKYSEIMRVNHFEVKVVVKRLNRVLTCEDGSNGDLIVACLDPQRQTIKTVMLQNSWQAVSKHKLNHNYIF